MLGKLGVWTLGIVALVGVVGFAKTSADLRNAREAVEVHTLTYAARQELRQALSERDLAKEQANEAQLQAAAMLREVEKVEVTAASIREAASRRDSLRLEEAQYAAALAAKREEIEKGEILRQDAEAMLRQINAERDAAQEEVRQATAQIAALQGESQALEADLAERRREAEPRLAAVARQVEDLDAQRGDLEAAVARLRSDHATVTLDLAKAKKRHDELIAENENLAAAREALSSEAGFATSHSMAERSMSEIDREAEIDLEDVSREAGGVGSAEAGPEPVESAVDAEWAALAPIPLPPVRPRELRAVRSDPAEPEVAPAQTRRRATVTAPPPAVTSRRTVARPSGRATVSGGSSRTAEAGPAALSLPSALLPETPALGVR
jgi:chromosome segregation ATPase